MKGMELCQRYFWEVGFSAIKQDLPECPMLSRRFVGRISKPWER